MKLLFLQGGSRIKRDENGFLYTDGNFNSNVWNRYLDLSKNLTVILREETKKYTVEEAQRHFNLLDNSKIDVVILPDMYSPKSNFFSLSMRKILEQKIERAVINSDGIIIRSLGNIYVNLAIKYAKKHKKPYLLEVTGVYWDNSWYHSFFGKILAPFREYSAKRSIKNAPYAVYVTEKALQERYPCDGITLGCSDVELKTLDSEILEKRLKKISEKQSMIVLGTAGFVNLKTKGQQDVIKALGILKKSGITSFKYSLIGLGDDSYLRRIAKENGVEEQVAFLGGKTHEEVFNWLDSIDIYVQPSYQEGLCRAIVEAISRACPVICSDAGGNNEIIESNFIFKRGDINGLLSCLRKMNNTLMKQQAQRNFKRAEHYDKIRLDKIRNQFYNKFIDTVGK